MRVISGTWRGRTLQTPAGKEATRPTSDRAKEALFSILMARLADAQVLDLFAGSGALGIEAVSRGARGAVLVDSDRAACAAIAANIAALDASACVRLMQRDAFAAMRSLGGMRFDIVFMDPPYASGLYRKALGALVESDLLADGGIVVVESDAKSLPEPIDGLCIADRRRYGIAVFTFFSKEGCG